MNIYSIAFPFDGEYFYANFDANMIANHVLMDMCGDYLADLCTEHNQWFDFTFTHKNSKYKATFSIYGNTISVYELSDDDDENLVEKDIPYHVIKITNKDEVIYNIADLI